MRNLYLRLALNIAALIGAGVVGGVLVSRNPQTASIAEYFFWGPALAIAVTILAMSLALRAGRYRAAVFDYTSDPNAFVELMPPLLLAGCALIAAAGLLIDLGANQELFRLVPPVIGAYFGGTYGKELWKADAR